MACSCWVVNGNLFLVYLTLWYITRNRTLPVSRSPHHVVTVLGVVSAHIATGCVQPERGASTKKGKRALSLSKDLGNSCLISGKTACELTNIYFEHESRRDARSGLSRRDSATPERGVMCGGRAVGSQGFHLLAALEHNSHFAS